MSDDPWFVPKTYGYGATPANWKGWAVTFVFMIATIGLAMLPSLVPTVFDGPDWPVRMAAWLAVLAILVMGFVAFVRARTEGEWRWRWGEKE